MSEGHDLVETDVTCLRDELLTLLTANSRFSNVITFDKANAAFNKKKTLFTSKLDLHLRNKPVNSYIWSIFLYGVDNWTFWKVD